MSYEIKPYELSDIVWAVEVAAYNSITQDAKREELVNLKRWYELGKIIDEHGIGFIAWKGEERVGMIGSLIAPNIFNPEIRTSTILVWYVLPEHRKSRASLLLFKEMEKESLIAADEMTFSLQADNLIKESTLDRLGFKKAEVAFSKKLKE